jgi:radial spoke head protein 4A
MSDIETFSFEKAKLYLKRSDAQGRSLYDHLTEVLLAVLQQQPDDPLATFEGLSAQLKQGQFALVPPKEVSEAASNPALRKQLLEALQRTSSLLAPPPPKEGEEPAPEVEPGVVPDLLAQARLLEAAGVGMGYEETYKLMLALTALAARERLVSVRFFGKFFGTRRDYLIAEARLAEYPPRENDDDPFNKVEAPGEGANASVYFAANSAAGPWTRLPDVTPEQIKTARQMRRLLSGDLSAQVAGYPRFPWGEAALLRAQIARIGAATVLAPRGALKLDEEADEPRVVEDEEFKGAAATELTGAGGWVHAVPALLRQGRVKKWKAPPKEEEEEEEADAGKPKRAADEDENDDVEPPELLRGVDADAEAEAATPAWTFRVDAREASAPHAIASAHSVLWPGAVAVAQGRAFVSFYVGNGLRRLSQRYAPPPVPAVMGEFAAARADDEAGGEAMREQDDPLPPPPQEKEEEKGEAEAEAEAEAEDA